MIDQLKQVGILYGEGKNCQITGENIKSADYSKMSKEEVEEFCQSLEILLAVGIEGEIDSLIEECPCMLLWFAQSAPEILPESPDILGKNPQKILDGRGGLWYHNTYL